MSEHTCEDSVYEELGVPTVVNAAGTKTRIGGSRIRPEALEDMRRAAGEFVELGDLQARASELIAEVTGAEAGYVTSGAAAGLLLSAAAAIAGTDVALMDRLPDTGDVPDEIVMPRTHRTGYDHALRAAGATIVDVGTNDHHLGTGATNVEPWEIERAITDRTVAVGYVQKSYTRPDLSVVTEIAHDNDVPVIVDAAAEAPPVENLSAFVEAGADVVVFSGGKGIRGPQTTGIVAGEREYIESIAAQHLDMHVAADAWNPPEGLIDRANFDGVPRQGIGRPMKVGKEELVGLVSALDSFVEEDQQAVREEWSARIGRVTDRLREGGLDVTTTEPEGTSVAPEAVVSLSGVETSARDLVAALRDENPRVYVGADSIDADEIVVNPMCLTDDEADYAVSRILAVVDG
ncbi:aminotransferase class V-fold PLP-dependent enzyme [Haloarcula nitratireducens]|uniref:Aminotransferase class V-fold PLP-dependent enzyme n=1 Tax=Haloarcula nitratireducens TaxID=2487749 RepID=A0AAW4PEX1_9EURY|nr:aminotransferase class V-fold PLP-dependent enzyme [Halomicroarcula nitratireducens]MBX0296148.1 aminotransferase class V-fold PLP-dependent enzyme [Halomicroarcula nitratireducens]